MLRRPMVIVGLCGICVATVGAVVLVAWLTGSIALVRMRPDLFPMPFNAAIGLLLLGVALILLGRGHGRPAAVLGLALAVLGSLSLAENATGTSLGIDELFWSDRLTDLGVLRGQIPVLASLTFTGTGLLFATTPLRWEPTVRSAAESTMGSLLFWAGLVAFLAQLAGFGTAFGASAFMRVSAHGALSIVLVGVALQALPWARWVARKEARQAAGPASGAVDPDDLLHPLLGWWLPLPTAAGTFAGVLVLWGAVTTTLLQTGGTLDAQVAGGAILVVAAAAATVLAVAARLWAAAVIARQRLSAEVARRSRAEDALRESAEQLETVANYSPDIIARLDLDLRHLYVNPAGEALLGMTREAIVGRSLAESGFPRQVSEAAETHMRSVIEAGTPVTMEYELSDAHGQLHTFEMLLSAERGPEGATESIVAVSRDVTARREVERALRRSEEEYRAVFEQSLYGIDFVDADGRITQVNAALCELLGYTRDELVGRTVADITFPEDTATSERLLDSLARREIDHYVLEKRYVAKSGRIVEAMVYVSGLHDDAGRHVGATASVMDFTDRRTAERALRKSEERFRTLASHVPVGVFQTDSDGRIVYVNEPMRALTGLTWYEGMVDQWAPVLHPDDIERVTVGWTGAIARGEPFAGEFRLVRPDGSERWVISSAGPLRAADGEIVGYIGSCTDITDMRRHDEERRRLEAQVQHAQKLESLGLLAGGIAHDFNNMLVAILGNAGLALQQLPPESPAREELGDIEAAAQRAAELARQMLAYSGKGRFIVEPIDLSRLVEEMTHLLEAAVSKRAIIRRDFGSTLPPIIADATQVRQVVMNLMTNASDALGETGGIISIHTGSMLVDRDYLEQVNLGESIDEGWYVFVEVSDTGMGMDVETRERIFDPFFTTKHTGRGLGLAAVLGIVRGHRGAIKVYSEPGSGSTFKVLFPAAPEHAGPTISSALAAADTAAAGGTVLVVDDEASIRLVARRILEHSGYTVIDAANGREGIAAFREHADEIAAVLLDLTMPDLDGEETYRQLRLIRPRVRVVLTSGFNEQDTVSKFAGKGLAGFLQKPYRPEGLATVIGLAVAGRTAVARSSASSVTEMTGLPSGTARAE